MASLARQHAPLDANILVYMDIPVDRLNRAHEDVSRLGEMGKEVA